MARTPSRGSRPPGRSGGKSKSRPFDPNVPLGPDGRPRKPAAVGRSGMQDRRRKSDTERKPGAGKPGASRPSAPRPEGARPGPARPEGARPGPARPEGERSGPPRPEGARPGPPRPEGARPRGEGPPRAPRAPRPAGERPAPRPDDREAEAARAAHGPRAQRPPRGGRASVPTRPVTPNGKVPVRILHTDEHFLVVYKPAGVVTQPGGEPMDDTLLNGIFATHGEALAALGYARDFGLLHRLDRPTSGLVMVALTELGYDALRTQFATRTLKKTYVALVRGHISPARGTESSAIAEVSRDGRKRARVVSAGATVRGAQPAVTRWRTLAHNSRFSLLECEPETGRLHQIRAHMAHRGHAILGDRDYGPRDEDDSAFRRLAGKAIFLHAAALRFTHPVDGRALTIESPLPIDLAEALPVLGLTCPARWRP